MFVVITVNSPSSSSLQWLDDSVCICLHNTIKQNQVLICSTGYSRLRILGWWHSPGHRLADLRRACEYTHGQPKGPCAGVVACHFAEPSARSLYVWITGLAVSSSSTTGYSRLRILGWWHSPGCRLAGSGFAQPKGPCTGDV